MTRPQWCSTGYQSYEDAEEARDLRDAQEPANPSDEERLAVRRCKACTWWHILPLQLAVRAVARDARGGALFDPELLGAAARAPKYAPPRARDVREPRPTPKPSRAAGANRARPRATPAKPPRSRRA